MEVYNTVLLGISWRRHQRQHHQHYMHTNDMANDPDLRTTPFLVYDPALPRSRITRYQRWLLLPYLSAYVISWRLSSLRTCCRHRWFSDIGFSFLHWVVLAWGLAATDYATWQCIAFAMAADAFTGVYMATIFMMNHFLEECIAPDAPKPPAGAHVAYDAERVLCLVARALVRGAAPSDRTPPLPVLPHHLPHLVPLVRTVCAEHQLPYHHDPAPTILRACWHRLGVVARMRTTEGP
jgi:hypothetical protein